MLLGGYLYDVRLLWSWWLCTKFLHGLHFNWLFLRDHIPLKYWSGLKFFDCTFYNYVYRNERSKISHKNKPSKFPFKNVKKFYLALLQNSFLRVISIFTVDICIRDFESFYISCFFFLFCLSCASGAVLSPLWPGQAKIQKVAECDRSKVLSLPHVWRIFDPIDFIL